MPRTDARNLTGEQRSEIARRAGKARVRRSRLAREDYARMGRKGAASLHAKRRARIAEQFVADEPQRNADGPVRFRNAQQAAKVSAPIDGSEPK